jgi:hypothetical protein
MRRWFPLRSHLHLPLFPTKAPVQLLYCMNLDLHFPRFPIVTCVSENVLYQRMYTLRRKLTSHPPFLRRHGYDLPFGFVFRGIAFEIVGLGFDGGARDWRGCFGSIGVVDNGEHA